MDKYNAKDYLPLVQALAEGKMIERLTDDGYWLSGTHFTFEKEPTRYRIKPEPRKAWVWWPGQPNRARYNMRVYATYEAASWAAKMDGGHITEVTE